MAKKRRNDDSDPDDLSRDFGPNPEEHPDAKAFIGYLRQAPDKTSWRLYLSLDFNDYLEVPKDALIDHRTLASRTNPLAGDVAWIRGGARLRRVSVTVREGQAEFLRGEIISQHLSTAARIGIPRPNAQPTIDLTDRSACLPCNSRDCGPTQFGCNRSTMACPTRYCPSASFDC